MKCLYTFNKDDSATDCFRKLGEGLIPTELDNGELPLQVQGFGSVRLLCILLNRSYNSTSTEMGAVSLEELEGREVASYSFAFVPLITHTNYIAMWPKSYTTIFLLFTKMTGM